jgi:2-C-methyl-D-erythritol 4-phosphate cytidylyltransferase
MEKAAVIVAGGTGTRMGTETPKQFLELHGRPVVAHTMDAFFAAFPDIQIILVLPDSYLEEGHHIISKYFPGKPVIVTSGGKTRFDSVKNGLYLVKEPSVVFVHDAVRCLVSPSLIRDCYEAALIHGSAIPVIPVKDSIRRIHGNGSEVVNREQLRAVQTPQTFLSEILLPAFLAGYQDSFTDEATVVEHNGDKVHLVTGEETNIKITVQADLDFARRVIGKQLNA